MAVALLTIENLYHRTTPGSQPRYVVLAAGLSLVIIVFHLLLNELVEVDKIGSFFFIDLFLLIRVGSWVREESTVK